MRLLGVALVACVAASPLARADDSTAEAAYTQAEALVKAGKWEQACPLYEASYKADRQIGVLLHAADCNEHVGKLASAWLEFTEAADLAGQKKDAREAFARGRADALAPKLAHLHITPPSPAPHGLAVTRDGVDITPLVGTDIPIDTGMHDIVASAPGFKPWSTTVGIADGQAATTEIPQLEKAPEKPPEAAVPKEGSLVITTQADADIVLDGKHVGTAGKFAGPVVAGGHTLRVTAPHMMTYQTEVYVNGGQSRTIDVPLEQELAYEPLEPPGPDIELGLGFSGGEKLRNGNPALSTMRGELGFRLGRRVNFGFYTEVGSLSRGGSCGFDLAGSAATTPVDFGIENQMTSCWYVMPGLQLLIHIRPRKTIDPYIGLTPGFRIGFLDWNEYTGGVMTRTFSETMPAIVVPVRVGVNYHPSAELKEWEVGGFVEAAITVFGQEIPNDLQPNGGGGGTHFVSLLGGIRSTVAF